MKIKVQIYQNLWDVSEIVIAMKVYNTKEEKYQININKLEKRAN